MVVVTTPETQRCDNIIRRHDQNTTETWRCFNVLCHLGIIYRKGCLEKCFPVSSWLFLLNIFVSNSSNSYNRRSHRRCSIEIGVLKNFTNFTGKHLCQSLLFSKVRPYACNFIKKETLALAFSCEFCEIFKNTFLQNASGRLLLLQFCSKYFGKI